MNKILDSFQMISGMQSITIFHNDKMKYLLIKWYIYKIK